ncbi:hypothetical protein DOTSEDRAFT_141627 [Dothistroma septosporum NZE10]|uniref:Uncharacterized protein n=1 Tax=Dothistroma septosporum (strain NZE10 / CBS 128990) TaxID=675120 RepID=N1PZU9_DOTSN|nr:hypothetical protein DOTSEDRAFT_141627 [Dothistroma septosporum NZE10]
MLLTLLGTVVSLYYAARLASFIHLHFFHQSTLQRYRQARGRPEESAWALVTGATDGIGKGFAEELCHRGFNVVIHGRNQHKLESVKSLLNKSWPNQQVQILKIDASKDAGNADVLSRAAANLTNFDLKVLINNLGGNGGLGVSFMPLHERTPVQIRAVMDINARFPTEITRAVLPQLRENSPALIINVGSTTSDFGLPYLSIYSGCKSYNKGWSRSLTAEMRAEESNVEVFCLMVSAVATNYVPRAASLFAPTARQMASYSLDKVGCGKSIVFGYWAHAVQAAFFYALPDWLAEKTIIDVGIKEKKEDEERAKKR